MTASEQLGLEGMPRRLLRATPTRLTTWLDCPRRYRFSYLDRPMPAKGPPWAHNSLGAAVHTAIASWWRLPAPRRTPEAAGDLLERGWLRDGFRDEEQSERWRARARAMVEDYVAALDPTEEPVGVERVVALRTSVLALSGRADRIDQRVPPSGWDGEDDAGEHDPEDGAHDDGLAHRATAFDGAGASDGRTVAGNGDGGGRPRPELVIVDYKTGRRPLTADDARGSLALAVYAAAAERTLRRPCRRVELHHLPTRTVVGWTHTPESLARHLARADAIGEEAADAEAVYPNLSGPEMDAVFPPRPGPQCHWCDFAAHCPEGRDAYPTRRSWEGLDPNG